MVYMPALEAGAAMRVGSNPTSPTKIWRLTQVVKGTVC